MEDAKACVFTHEYKTAFFAFFSENIHSFFNLIINLSFVSDILCEEGWIE